MLTCFSWSFPKDLKIISHRIIGFVENLLIVHCKQCCLTNSITRLKHYSDYTKLRTLLIQRTLGYVSRFISSKTACNIVLNWEFQLVVLLSYCWLSLWLFALAVFKTALKFSFAGNFKFLWGVFSRFIQDVPKTLLQSSSGTVCGLSSKYRIVTELVSLKC